MTRVEIKSCLHPEISFANCAGLLLRALGEEAAGQKDHTEQDV
jgi:hypothetical protein